MDEHASVDEGVTVGKRVNQGRETATDPTEAPEAASAASGPYRAAPRSGQGAAGGRNGSADWLGRGLRRLYQGTVNEPIPEKFRELLSRLDEQSGDAADAVAAPARAPKAGDQP